MDTLFWPLMKVLLWEFEIWPKCKQHAMTSKLYMQIYCRSKHLKGSDNLTASWRWRSRCPLGHEGFDASSSLSTILVGIMKNWKLYSRHSFLWRATFQTRVLWLRRKLARNWGDRKRGRIGFRSHVQPGAAQIDLVPAISLVKQAGSFIFVASI